MVTGGWAEIRAPSANWSSAISDCTVTIADKLHPDRFSAMSGKMAAIVAYILGESWTEPEIAALSVTSDGFV
jgi:hypothetical protein